jgi:predicted TIM-barrel enzyme
VRSLVASPLVSLAALMTSVSTGCATTAVGDARPLVSAAEARAKLARVSSRPKQLWVVVHVRAHKTLRADGSVDEGKLFADVLASCRAVVEGGADMIILINARAEMPLYERVITAVRREHPQFPLGLSALAYGPSNLVEGFRLAKQFAAEMVWLETVPDEAIDYEEDEGRYVPADVIPHALAYDTQRRDRPEAVLTGGVHMKYTRPRDGRSFVEALRSARGKVDGVNITGPATGVLADVEHIRVARAELGDYPLGLASGVSVDNVERVLGLIDYAIVGTSLKSADDPLRTDAARVRALRQKMDALSAPTP